MKCPQMDSVAGGPSRPVTKIASGGSPGRSSRSNTFVSTSRIARCAPSRAMRASRQAGTVAR
eukprot:5248455-Alexandrium_andersonii.AAC.1